MDLAFGIAARRESAKTALAFAVKDRLGQDRARRIAGAQEQHVVGRVGHDAYPQLAVEAAVDDIAGAQQLIFAALSAMAPKAGLSP